MDALDKAIAAAGGVGALATQIEVTQTAVSNWRARGTVIPPVHCAAIERAAGGAVTRRDLRPDDWWRIWPELVNDEFPAPEAKAA